MLFAFSSLASYSAHYHFALYILAALSLSSASLIPNIKKMHLTSVFSHTPRGGFFAIVVLSASSLSETEVIDYENKLGGLGEGK